MTNRIDIPKRFWDLAIEDVEDMLQIRLKQKGFGALASTHEILGVVQEEVYELLLAVKDNNIQDVMKELEDIAVACIVGIASIKNGSMDW